MKSRLTILLSGIAGLMMMLTACGGGSASGGSPQPIGVSFAAQPPLALAASATASLSAAVNNDSGNAGVNWSANCASSLCGSFNPVSTPSGTATTFEAPAAIPGGSTVTITATSVSDATKSVSATITITAPAGVSVSFASQPPASLVQGLTVNLIAVVSGDSKNGGVSWTVACGSSACGTFNPRSTASNAATTYTAPSAVPAGSTVTVKATSASDATKSVSAIITITPPPPAVLSDGTYVYHLAGEDINDSGSPYYAAGAFTVKDGVITGGEQDYVDQAHGQTDTLVPSGCSMSTTNDGNLTIVLDTGDPNVGVNGVETLRGSKVAGSRVLIAEFDSFASASGSLDLQTSPAMPTGGYAFNLSGLDGSTSANALFIGGILDISGSSVSISNSVFDYNDNGSVGQGEAFASGSVSAPDSFGRITIGLSPSIASGVPQFGMSGYIVGAYRIELIEDLPDALNGVLGGTALGQGSNTGTFTPASVEGGSYTYSGVGADINGVATIAGAFVLNPNGIVSGNIALADMTCCGGANISGNWTIAPNGRVTITNVTPSLENGVPFAFQLYMDGSGNALELGVDSTQGTAGRSYLQASDATLNPGSYSLAGLGFSNLNNQPVWAAVGPVSLGSSLDWNGFTDYNALGTNQFSSVALSGASNSTTGAITIAGLDITNQSADMYGYYPIDGRRNILIEVDQNQLGLILIEEVTP